MKRIFWRILEDSNRFRTFRSTLSSKESLLLLDNLQTNSSLVDKWKPVQVKLAKEKEEKEKPIADFIAIDLAFRAMSERAKQILTDLIIPQVEFLPFETPVGPYYGLHVKYVDCLDVNRAEVVRFKSSGRIMEVEKYAFYWERLEGIHIFHLPELVYSRLFVSDEFKRVVEENGLTGLLFYPVPLVEEE